MHLDRAGREGLAHQPAQPRVVGRVAEQHRARQRRLLGGVAVHRREHLLELLAPEPLVAQDGHAVLVAREHPEAHRRLVHGILLAQPPVERVRIGVELGQERIEQDFGGRHQRASASHRTSAGCLARRPARCWICWRQEMPGATTSVRRRRRLHGRRQPPVAERDRDVVVLALEAERAGHAAAAGVDLAHLVARPRQRVHRRRGAHDGLLVAVAVQQRLARRAWTSDSVSPRSRLAQQELLEQRALLGHRARLVGAQQVDRTRRAA